MQEIWTRWEPVNGLAEKYRLHAIKYTIRGINIIFTACNAHDKNILISFGLGIDAHRETKNEFRKRTFLELEKNMARPFTAVGPFFK